MPWLLYISTLSIDKGGTNKATGRAVESWDSVLLGRSHWTVTRVYADLLALCSPASHSSLISSGLCGRGRGLTEAGRGPSIAVYLWLDQDPSYCRETRCRSRDWKSHVPFPLPPTPGPFATDGSCLIYIAESCDGAPLLPSFVLPSSPHHHHHQPSWQHCSNWKDKQFYQSRKLDGDVKWFRFNVSFIICGTVH